MARHPILTLLTCLLSLAAAHMSPRDAHAAEIGYDTRENKFSGRIPPACAEKMKKQGTVPQCVLVELFTRHLTLDLKVQRTDSPNAAERSLPDVLRDALIEDRQLLEDLNALYQQSLGHRDFQEGLHNLRIKLTELAALYGGFDLGKPLYEPPAEKPAKRTGKTDDKPAAADPAKPALPKVTAPADALDRLVKLAALDHTKDFGVAGAEFKLAFKSVLDLVDCTKIICDSKLFPTGRYTVPAAADPKKLAAIDSLWATSRDVVDQLAVLHAIALANRTAPSVASVTTSDGFVRMLGAVQSVTVDEGENSPVTSAGPRQAAFPFYASVDIGLAPIVFSRSTVNLAQYFAINLYFTAVDPDEPLYDTKSGRSHGYGFLRRFSISAGITTTGRQIENTRNVSGLVGSQLPLLGLGFRVLRMVRVSGGVALYNLKDPNPVVDRSHLGVAPYIALSLDVALFNWARGLLN